jgi:Family of unknown function (DUF5681)
VTHGSPQNRVRNTSGFAPPFKPGQSGNPGGRPKLVGISAAKLLSRKIRKCDPLAGKFPELVGKTWAEAIVYGQGIQAVTGKTEAANFVAERAEGKVKDELEVSGSLDVYSALAEARRRKRGE